MSVPTSEGRGWVPLSARERRVMGVLVEKQKTTPDNYPMSLAAIVTGCNQKSNRDPVTSYDADDVEETLHALREKGACILTEGSGRVEKWKHALYDWLDLKHRPREMAVIAELLLRGPQTEGELRVRASRMDAIADLPALEEILGYLQERNLVVYLSPPGQRRGVIVTHGLYPPEELDRLSQKHLKLASAAAEADDEPEPGPRSTSASPRAGGWMAEVEALRAELQTMQDRLQRLETELTELKASLGAD